MKHRHFKVLYERNPQHVKLNSNPGAVIAKAAEQQFGAEAIRYSKPKVKNVSTDFPVLVRGNTIQSAVSVSETLSQLRPTAMDYVFIDPAFEPQAKTWLNQNREGILAAVNSEEDDGI
jgi:uncharacterized protein